MSRRILIGISVAALIVTLTSCQDSNPNSTPSTPAPSPAVGG